MMCRGLITDLEGNIVARPFPKFFNLSQHEGHEVSEHEGFRLPPINWMQDFTVTEKLDGSLGILYFVDGKPFIATRGSFTSDQAKRGTEIFYKKGYDRHAFDQNITHLFEIIYPENRIVVDYGDMEDLVLLEMVNVDRGDAVSYDKVRTVAGRIGCRVVDYMALSAENIQRLEEYYGQSNGANEEGVVVRFADGTRVKVKYEEYCRLHKLVTGVNARRIWECLMHKAPLDDMLKKVPDEFFAWVTKTKNGLLQKYDDMEQTAKRIIDAGDEEWSQKEWALYFLHDDRKHLAGVLFQMLKKQDYSNHIWKMLKPAHTSPFKDDPDA